MTSCLLTSYPQVLTSFPRHQIVVVKCLAHSEEIPDRLLPMCLCHLIHHIVTIPLIHHMATIPLIHHMTRFPHTVKTVQRKFPLLSSECLDLRSVEKFLVYIS